MIREMEAFGSRQLRERKGFVENTVMVKKVLIADDSSFMRMTLKDILAKEGYQIVGEAGTGEEAVTKYKELRPDLVTMDIVMLGEGGVQAVKEILKIDTGANVLMVSAIGNQSLVAESLEMGAKGFIMKPFKPAQVLSEIKRIIHE